MGFLLPLLLLGGAALLFMDDKSQEQKEDECLAGIEDPGIRATVAYLLAAPAGSYYGLEPINSHTLMEAAEELQERGFGAAAACIKIRAGKLRQAEEAAGVHNDD